MAVYVRHVLSTEIPKLLVNSTKLTTVTLTRGTASHKKVKKLPKRYIQNVPIQPKLDSIASRGFLRNLHPFQPPENVTETLMKYFQEHFGTTDLRTPLKGEKKFQLLVALSKEFSYTVPNSILYEMNSLIDVLNFYTTPVDMTAPYDKLKTMELPPNLHVLHDYYRFHPDTDTMFNGVSAFPKSSTIVSGLKTKKKYKGFDAGNPWNDI